MRLLTAVALAAILGCMSLVAADNPAAGRWKLNRVKSQTSAPLPPFVVDGLMTIPREIATDTSLSKAGRMPQRSNNRSGGTPILYKFDLSPDGRVLTVTRKSDACFRMVFDRQ
jgi:hypothetical protein